MDKTKCELCWKECSNKINYTYIPINFTWDRDNKAVPNTFFCSQQHRKDYIKEHNDLVKRSLPFLAELDQSMNYCEYFVRDKGNEGLYIRGWFKYKVNWLWDYKSTPKSFIESFEKYFGHRDYYKLHRRYE